MCETSSARHIRGMTSVTRGDRRVDLVALLLIAAGGALYVDGAARLREVARLSFAHPGPRGVKQLDVADRARYEANGGMVLVALGGLTGVAGAVRAARRRPPPA